MLLLAAVALLWSGAGCSGARAPVARTAGASAPPPLAQTYRASSPLAASYGERELAELGAFEARVVARLAQVAQELGKSPPGIDRAAHRAAAEICRAMPALGPPPSALVEFALRGQGIVDPPPHMVIAYVPDGDEDAVIEQLADRFQQILSRRAFNRAGVALARPLDAPSRQRVVVALLESRARFAPFPRRMARDQEVELRFEVEQPFHGVKLVVTRPGGEIISSAPAPEDSGYRHPVRCEEAGSHQVEVTGEGPFGVEVLANFPMYCATDPPTMVRFAPLGRLPNRVEEMEQDLFARTNSVRAARGLSQLRANAAVGAVARAHSEDMRDSDFVGHVSPRTGRPVDRLQRVPVPHLVVRENVARAYSTEEALKELMNSPAHRDNILSRDVTDVGIGVAVERPSGSGGLPVLLVTQLFIEPARPYDAKQAPLEILAVVRRARKEAGLSPLKLDEGLSRLAARYVGILVDNGGAQEPADAWLGSALRGVAGRFTRVDGLNIRVGAIEAIARAEELRRGRYSHLGIGVTRLGQQVAIFLLLAAGR